MRNLKSKTRGATALSVLATILALVGFSLLSTAAMADEVGTPLWQFVWGKCDGEKACDGLSGCYYNDYRERRIYHETTRCRACDFLEEGAGYCVESSNWYVCYEWYSYQGFACYELVTRGRVFAPWACSGKPKV